MSSYQLPEDRKYVEVHPRGAQEDRGVNPRSPRHSNGALLPSTHSGTGHVKREEGKTTTQSGSDTEKEPSKMSPRKHSSSISRRDKPSSRIKKTDDWTEVTEPDERRRIQNRIAQRKFREKAREARDRAQREAMNQQYAGSAYHIPDPDDLVLDDGELSGLPWGGINMRHVVARGHASASAGHHTLSLHSSHSASVSVGAGARRDSGTTTTTTTATTAAGGGPGPDLVDHALYNMNPYGYAPAAHPIAAPAFDTTGGGAGGDGGSSVGGGDVYYDSPYGYYDFDATPGDTSHAM